MILQYVESVQEKDPDGNGRTTRTDWLWSNGRPAGGGFDQIKLWFGAPNVWGERDGQLVPEFEYDEYLEALKFMKSCMTKNSSTKILPSWTRRSGLIRSLTGKPA